MANIQFEALQISELATEIVGMVEARYPALDPALKAAALRVASETLASAVSRAALAAMLHNAMVPGRGGR